MTASPGHDLQPLFEPRGIVVAGASTHPGKFGFVSLHNILASGYQGALYALNRDGTPVLDVPTVTSFDDIPDGAVDLVFVCTPASANPDLLRAAAARGVRAAFIAAAGYGEGDGAGRHLQDELVALCDELGVIAAGPNGQGVVSPPVGMCAQIVGPNPPAGHIAVASQSGNLVSSFLNYAVQTGVGISRAVSAGNAAMLGRGRLPASGTAPTPRLRSVWRMSRESTTDADSPTSCAAPPRTSRWCCSRVGSAPTARRRPPATPDHSPPTMRSSRGCAGRSAPTAPPTSRKPSTSPPRSPPNPSPRAIASSCSPPREAGAS